MSTKKWALSIWTSVLCSTLAGPAMADCSALPNWQGLKTALANVVAAGGNGGLGLNMWGTLVATDGTVCALAFSGNQYVDQWLGSRVISAQKANTANAFSLKGLPLSTLGPLRSRIGCLTSHGGLTGVPQVNVPGAEVDSVPVGLSILAARGNDAMLIAVANALEAQ